MGQGRPTSRPSNYITDLEVLLEAKNERIEELKVELRRKTIAHGAHLIEENVQLKRKVKAGLKLADELEKGIVTKSPSLVIENRNHVLRSCVKQLREALGGE